MRNIQQQEQKGQYSDRLALLIVCRHYTGVCSKALIPQPVLFQRNKIQSNSWQLDTKRGSKNECKSVKMLRWETTKLVEQFLIDIDHELKDTYRNEIAILAHNLESNLFTTAPSRLIYEDIYRLGVRTKILLRYTARYLLTNNRAPVRFNVTSEEASGRSFSGAMGA